MNGLNYILRMTDIKVKDISNELGMSATFLYSMASGDKPIPRMKKIALGKFFKVDPSYLDKILTTKEKIEIDFMLEGREYLLNSEKEELLLFAENAIKERDILLKKYKELSDKHAKMLEQYRIFRIRDYN